MEDTAEKYKDIWSSEISVLDFDQSNKYETKSLEIRADEWNSVMPEPSKLKKKYILLYYCVLVF